MVKNEDWLSHMCACIAALYIRTMSLLMYPLLYSGGMCTSTIAFYGKLLCSLSREPVGADTQAQGCAGEGLNPKRAYSSPAHPPASSHLLPSELVGTDTQGQGCAVEGLKPELRARVQVVTCEMSLFESII